MIRSITLRVLETFIRHWLLYVLPIFIMMGFAGYYVATQASYVADSVVNVANDSLLSSLTSLPGEWNQSWVTPAQAASNEVNELLRTDAFVRAIIQNTDLEEGMSAGPDVVEFTIEQVRSSIWAETLGDNQIKIVARHESPEIAYQLVNSLLDSFIQWKANSGRADIQAAQKFFANLIVDYEQDLEIARQALENYLIDHPEPIRGERPSLELLEIERLQSDISRAETRYVNALNNEEDAKLAMQQFESDIQQTYYLMDAPMLPTSPEWSKKELAMILAVFLLVGGIFSAGLIAVNTILDRTIRFPEEIVNQYDLPVLGLVRDFTQQEERSWLKKLFRGRKVSYDTGVIEEQPDPKPANENKEAEDFDSGTQGNSPDVEQVETDTVDEVDVTA